MKQLIRIALIIAAATIGEGIFGLPYTFAHAGWILSLAYLIGLAAIVSAAHVIYLKTLAREGEKKRLLGLARDYLGNVGFWIGILAIVIGLLFALIAYLVIGGRFLTLALPSLNPLLALGIFWAIVSLPLFANDAGVRGLEVAGVTMTAAIVIFAFANAFPHETLRTVGTANAGSLFLPFGIILLSLAGWTGIEPAYESRKSGESTARIAKGIVFGTALAAGLYLLFIAGILGSGARITQDTISGIAAWAAWKRYAIALMGLIAVGTSYMPISRELRNSLEKDMRWHPLPARLTIAFGPLVAILLGFNNFFAIVGLAGGVFVSLEYLLIILVGKRALGFSARGAFFANLLAAVFVAAAIYEAWFFIVK